MPYASGKKRIDYQKERRKKFLEDGKCTRCGGEIDTAGMDCSRCRNKSNTLTAVAVARNLAEGKCRCGRPAKKTTRCCERCAERSRNVLRDLKEQVLQGYEKRCVCCGETAYEFLSVDHKYNDGAADRKRLGRKAKSGSLYKTIIKENFPDRYQIMCYNCNMAKGFFGYCPHQKETQNED